MRTVYLGTSAFAGVILRQLSETTHRPQLVVSRPDRPSGRGRKLTVPPAVEVARELGIDVCQPESVNGDDARRRIADAHPQTLVVCAYGALIKEPLLSEHPILNVHPSLLPRWRGAAPIERAILAGDRETGVSIMQLTAGLDSGPVCLQQSLPIARQDDYGATASKLQTLGAELLTQALDLQAAGELEARFREQDEAGVTYAEKLTADDRLIDPSRPASEVWLQVRALSPHIGAYLLLSDESRLGVWAASPADQPTDPIVAAGQSLSPGGELVAHDGRLFLLAGRQQQNAASQPLELTEVQPPGKRRMAAGDYVRGLKL